jgi:CubicO group peptidase (beta-lactamase class C family)
MHRQQFRVLYRDFLFSIVDRELLSTHATGDASRLLLQLVTLLVCLSVCFCFPALALSGTPTALFRLSAVWSIEHFLIATTMLVVGVFAVLSWDRILPGPRDLHVLGPLPIHPNTILLARLAATGTALGVAILALHAATGAIWPLALSATSASRPLRLPSYAHDAALAPIAAMALQRVLDRGLADARRDGPLAPGAGGGVAVGIYERGRRHVFTYGAAAPDSLFQIGSATKPFTGVLLADMVERGTVSLQDPVRALLPAAGFGRPSGPEITLLDLVTHRSGLPGMPPRFRASDPNPAADFGAADLYALLRTRSLEKARHEPYRYSNVGFGLLGHALSLRAGVDYATLAHQTITGPLGMRDTVLDLSPAHQRRFLQGHSDDRRPVPAWDFDVLAAAGGLKSTVADMLTWLEANLHPERVSDPRLAAALAASHRIHSTIDRDTELALAWRFRPASGEYEHGGAVLGFSTDAFFNPRQDLAVVVLANAGPGTAVSADVIGRHIRARLEGSAALSLAEVVIPPTGGLAGWARLSFAYWATMIAAGVFVFALALAVQRASALVPRRLYLRLSPWLQFAAFSLVVGTYFLQPMLAQPGTIVSVQERLLAASPSFWFLGLFQQLSGSPALAPLAQRAWLGLAVAIGSAIALCSLSYARTLRQVAEQPDAAPRVVGAAWLPLPGSGPERAAAWFGVTTVLRSAPHRMIVAFYWSLGFALTLIALKLPRGQQTIEGPTASGWDDTGVPLIVSSIVMMTFAVLAARLAFAMPRDIEANWIFRVTLAGPGVRYLRARRLAVSLISVVPVVAAWAIGLFAAWPWLPALGHLVLLAALGMILVEVALVGPMKIPCTCSYLPGRSHAHLAFCAIVLWLVALSLRGAQLELEALQRPADYAIVLGALVLIWLALRWRASLAAGEPPVFDDEPADTAVTLQLADSRIGPATSPAIRRIRR